MSRLDSSVAIREYRTARAGDRILISGDYFIPDRYWTWTELKEMWGVEVKPPEPTHNEYGEISP